MRPRLSETHFYLLAFTLALGVRLLNLGSAPLSDSEAQWAMQAFQLTRGATSVGAQPGYIMITGLLFNLLPATNTLARLLPALLGSLIVFLPALLRSAGERLNFPRTAALILAFGLALDPTLTVLSRQVGSSMPAVVCLLLTLAALYVRRPILAGIFGGLALLSGPAVLHGALGLVLTYGLIYLLEKSDWIAPLQKLDELPLPETTDELPTVAATNELRPILKTWLYAAGVTVLIAGTFFLAYPFGLSGLAASLTSFFAGWASVSAISPLTPLAALLIYETLPLLFGLVGIGQAWLRKDGFAQRVSLWMLIAVVLSLLYPARQVGDLSWGLIGLWGLAALSLDKLIILVDEGRREQWVAMLQALFLLILMVVLRINLLSWQISSTEMLQIPLFGYKLEIPLIGLLVAGIFLMGLIATAMVVIGWSAHLARIGTIWAVVIGSVLSMLAANFWGTQLPQTNRYELWTVIPAAGQVDLFTKTIQQLSVTATGLTDQVDILSTVDTPSMRWALRVFPKAQFATQLSVTEQPAIVITSIEEESLESTGSYSGQDFVWAVYPGWQGVLPDEWMPWLAFRKAPVVPYSIILWARGDLFPAQASDQP
jgi:hypothetical protein